MLLKSRATNPRLFQINSARSVYFLAALVTLCAVSASIIINQVVVGEFNTVAVIVPLIVAPLTAIPWGLTILRATKEVILQTRKAEESELKTKAYEDAISNLTHDLRTPTSQVSGFLNLIDHKNQNGENARREIQMARSANVRLSKMIEDVLDITNSDVGREPIKIRKFDVGAELRQLTTSFQITAETKGINLALVDHTSVGQIEQDQSRFTRIIANLVDNAIKFTAVGSVTVTVSNFSRSEQVSYLKVLVEDTGIGIPAEQIGEVFEKFSRGGNSNAVDGLGLGLALVSRFVDEVGGTISISSVLGKGSCFEVVIPYELPVENALDPRRSTPSLKEPAPCILLVEDDDLNMEMAAMILEPLGRVVRAKNGAEAIEKFCQNSFDLIVMDYRMPVLDGFKAAAKIREIEKLNCKASTPIWGLSANTTEANRASAKTVGMNDLLSKPLTFSMATKLLSYASPTCALRT